MNEKIKLYDSELKVMELLWEGEMSARELAENLKERAGWSKTTTYTVIKKCVDKGAVSRSEPGFLCRAEITREEAQAYETEELLDRMYGGRADCLIAALIGGGRLSAEEIASLKRIVEELE